MGNQNNFEGNFAIAHNMYNTMPKGYKSEKWRVPEEPKPQSPLLDDNAAHDRVRQNTINCIPPWALLPVYDTYHIV